jgi:hypothetical protein
MTVVLCPCPILVDTVVPFGIRDIFGSVFKQNRSIIEDKTHSASSTAGEILVLAGACTSTGELR